MSNIYPIYTTVEEAPQTICNSIKEEAFDFPFFNHGANRARHADRLRCQLDEVNLDAADELLELKGMIFHSSHCGSTLLAQMLNQIEDVRVVSEPEAINGLLLSKVLYNINEEVIVQQLIKIVNLYRQKAKDKRFLLLKLTSWNVFEIEIFQKAFPEVKWVFIDRNTEALKKSLMAADGGFVEWWSHPVDILREKFVGKMEEESSKEDYLTKMINGHSARARRGQNGNSLFLEYPDFIAGYQQVLRHFSLLLTPEEELASQDVLKFDSKSLDRKLWRRKA